MTKNNVPHLYDTVQDLKHLFCLTQEKKSLYKRLKAGYKRGQDVEANEDRKKLVNIVWEDLIRAYQRQPCYPDDADAGQIKFNATHLEKLAESIVLEFPELGPVSDWFKKTGSRWSGYLNTKRSGEKSNCKQKRTITCVDPPILESTSKGKRKPKLPKDTAIGLSTKPSCRIEMDPEIEGIILESHLTASSYSTIYAEYKRLLIDRQLSFKQGVLDKFIYLKAFDGRLVSQIN